MIDILEKFGRFVFLKLISLLIIKAIHKYTKKDCFTLYICAHSFKTDNYN